MRPETLPKSYWKFIVKSGPIETPALEAVRRSIRKLPIDLHSFNAFIKKRGGTAFLTTAFPAQVSAAIIIAQQQLFGPQKCPFGSKKTPISYCIIKMRIAWGLVLMMQRGRGFTMFTWAARYNTWLLVKLTPKGVVFSFLSHFLFFTLHRFTAVQLALGLTCVVVCRSQMQCCTPRPHQLWCTV